MILADTDVLIDFLSGVQPSKDRITQYIESEQLQTTAITCFEILSGAAASKRGDAARKLIDLLSVVPLDRTAAARAADVRRTLDRLGLTIGMADSLIAGIALTHGSPLFTRNAKHFERVKELKLV